MRMEYRIPICDCRTPSRGRSATRHRCASNRQSAIGNRQFHGFAFTEVLFAVMILGLGFILLAGMFPVAIKQNQLTHDEIVGTQTVHNAISIVQSLATEENFPPTVYQPRSSLDEEPPHFIPVRSDVWEKIKGGVIDSSDPRHAWAAFYSRGYIESNGEYRPAPVMNVAVVALKAPPGQRYEADKDVTLYLDADPNTTDFEHATVTVEENDVERFPTTSSPQRIAVTASAEIEPGDIVRLIPADGGRMYPDASIGYRLWYEDASHWTLVPGDDYGEEMDQLRQADRSDGVIEDIRWPAYLERPSTIQPKMAFIRLIEGGTKPDRVEIVDENGEFPTEPPGGTGTPTESPAAEGSFLIVGNDQQYSNWQPIVGVTGQANGKILRLGKMIPYTDPLSGLTWNNRVFELQPGYDLGDGTAFPLNTAASPDWNSGDDLPLLAYVVGRRLQNPAKRYYPVPGNANEKLNLYTGLSQEVTVYKTTVPLRLEK